MNNKVRSTILICILVLVSGCDIEFPDLSVNQTIKYKENIPCMGVDRFTTLNGHTTQIMNRGTNKTIEECCCINGINKEFMCICNGNRRHIRKVAFGG